MKKIGLLLTAILLSPLAMAQTAPATPKAQAPQTWYVAPIVIDETSEAQKALTKEFTAQEKRSRAVAGSGSIASSATRPRRPLKQRI